MSSLKVGFPAAEILVITYILLTNLRNRGKILIRRTQKRSIMPLNKETAVKKAKQDLAGRLGISENDVGTGLVSDTEFPDMSLGAPASGEMSAQMISNGWRITLVAKGKKFEYRADKYQLRLIGFGGSNHVIIG